MSDNTIKVNIQGSTLKFELSIDKTDTILAVKGKICSQVMPDCQPTTLKLIYSGRILKDQQLVSECSLQEGQTVHLVKSSSVKSKMSSVAVPNRVDAPPVETTTTRSTPRPIVPILPIKPQNNPDDDIEYPPELDNLMHKLSIKAKRTAKEQPQANHLDLMMAGMMEEMASNPEILQQLMATQPEVYGQLGAGTLELGKDPEWLRRAAEITRHAALSGKAGEGPYVKGQPAPLMDLEALGVVLDLNERHIKMQKENPRPPIPVKDRTPEELARILQAPEFMIMARQMVRSGALADMTDPDGKKVDEDEFVAFLDLVEELKQKCSIPDAVNPPE